MPTYRVEAAKTGRSGCQNGECKKEGIKIEKGELRFGNLVEINGAQSWQWKHWGCVTPMQLEQWREMSEGDMDMVDGWDELPDEDMKDKVKRAIEQGHVDDDEWRGDKEKNRPGQKGFRLTIKEKKALGLLEDAESSPEKKKPAKSTKAKASRKRKTSESAESETEEPATKKKKMSGPKDAKPKANTGRKKAPVLDEESEDEEEVVPKPKKRGRKAKAVKEEDAEEEQNAPVEPAKRGRKPKAVKNEEGENHKDTHKPKKATARKKPNDEEQLQENGDNETTEVDEEKIAVVPKKRGRPVTKKIASANPAKDDDVPAAAVSVPSKRGRKRKTVN